mgnify:FL=1
MSGVINYLRNQSVRMNGKVWFLGGEGKDDGLEDLTFSGQHYFSCSNPDVSPHSCDECALAWSTSDSSFANYQVGTFVDVNQAKSQILEYYNKIAPSDIDFASYRPYRWETIDAKSSKWGVSATKYNSVSILLDNDNDVWWVIATLKQPENQNYIDLLKEYYEQN